MKISVITAVLDGARTLENTIESIDRQSHKDIEHIVVDGGSTDGTVIRLTAKSGPGPWNL